jgi:DNA-directed RNA polymerase subunit RPC12/RpoP
MVDSKLPMVTYVCIDCGKESTPKYESQFGHPRSEYRCFTCAQKLRRSDPIDIEKTSIAQRKRYSDPKEREAHKKIYEDQQIRNKISIGLSEFYKDPKNRENNSIRTIKAMATPEVKEKMRIGIKKSYEDPERKKRHSDGQIKRFSKTEERLKQSEGHALRWEDPKFVESVLQGIHKQGFWYGHPSINVDYIKPQYCELWKDVNPRVHAFFNYECVLCGKKENGRSHIGHHVFYVKEACCWFDEGGIYYTNLNAKDHKEKDYCIGENPNYFVILCPTCHGKTNGKFENRKKWADYFKDMIDEKYEGSCYLTKEEYAERQQ